MERDAKEQASYWYQQSMVYRGQPDLQSKSQDSQGYTEKPCLKKPKLKNKKEDPAALNLQIRHPHVLQQIIDEVDVGVG
ncbi:hypothetical protein STEG23_020266 [Scotinomys teguina]